ncbi:MAG: DNA topoisomerase IV [Spirochaetes bacterium GWF1_31_7]|nr:MAG: DNA topoisomerase IV [Spirochaetes bacterium GWE1_32_154]OHD48755.1 MAG: DNA topoisomerase IV [Spirochaetes bacterium GWE2_31_10]OHD52818.1 MAG: DNA topoisomerase IV [Spirochaetes bacterium GWF1_31_7]OHD76249.1 MAG: DNA topoisomerase IV [Spirochaetes bacterium RIFOXYB1_FULL_32_8]HBD95205.1 DNA topoisomerase IV [Spirochaetia bacterium]
MAKQPEHNYTDDKILTLDSLEHIRLRSGMYIGRLGDGEQYDDGIYILLKEVIDNSIDEFIMKYGNRVEIKLQGATLQVRDYGRGIPLNKIEDCVSIINTGGKFNDDVFQFSVGLNGVGTKAVNALSSHFLVRSNRDGKYREAFFSKGKLIKSNEGNTKDPNGTFIEFTPDEEIFGKFKLQDQYIIERLKNYSYLNRGLKLIYNGEEFYSENGLEDLLNNEVEGDNLYNTIHFRDEKLEYAFCHTANMGETYFSFVNGQHTNEGGTHQAAFREAILKGINEYSGKSFNGSDVREGIVGAVAIKLKNPIFESQTKNKLGNIDIKSELIASIKDSLVIYLHRNQATADKIIDRIKFNEMIRTEFQKVQKEARENAKKTALNIPKLKDCKIHFNDESLLKEKTTIFLTEGQSASGSMVGSRDVMTQAIFSLRGKPLNAFGLSKSTVYKNEEMYNLMKALGLENGIEDLRYNKVVIATDADVDGFHIRNLILTFFLIFFEPVVLKGHLYILETPLFRVRNKQETIYCYSEEQKEKACKKLKGFEITRFKGLGEISPNEFGQFIGENIKLTKVNVNHINEVNKSLKFYMGNNTPERKEYIMEHLL